MSLQSIKASFQAALAVVGYNNSVSASQVEQDLKSISNNLITTTPMIQAIPTTRANASVTQILVPVPQGIKTLVSISRATSSLSKLSSPLTANEGSAFLTILQDIQTQFITLLNAYNARALTFEIIPGITAWGMSTVQGLMDSLIRTFMAAAPANVSPSAIQKIQTNISSAIQNTSALVPAQR